MISLLERFDSLGKKGLRTLPELAVELRGEQRGGGPADCRLMSTEIGRLRGELNGRNPILGLHELEQFAEFGSWLVHGSNLTEDLQVKQ